MLSLVAIWNVCEKITLCFDSETKSYCADKKKVIVLQENQKQST